MFDTHAHLLPMAAKGVALESVIGEARANGIAGIVDVGITPGDIVDRARTLGDFSFVRFALGLHPTEISPETAESQFAELSRQLSAVLRGSSGIERVHERMVAIGEIGLDYHWGQSTAFVQQETLERLFSLASANGLPVILHNRESEQDMLELVRRHKPIGVMHCFSQGREYCKKLLDLGMYISFGGNITYKKSDNLREAALLVPDELLLVETDSPYLSPQAVRGTNNHPGHLGFTIQALADLRKSSYERITKVTSENAQRLFKKKEPANAGS